MLSSTFPFIFNTAPLKEGETFGEPDIRPADLTTQKCKHVDASSSSSVVTESTTSESDLNDSLNDSSNSSMNTSLNSRESSHSSSSCSSGESSHSIEEVEQLEVKNNEVEKEETEEMGVLTDTVSSVEEEKDISTVVDVVEGTVEEEVKTEEKSSIDVPTAPSSDAVAKNEVIDEEKKRVEEAEAVLIAKRHREAKEYFYKLYNGKIIKELMSELESVIHQNQSEDILQFSADYLSEKIKTTKAKQEGPKPIVFAGPSGVGKGTIVNILMKRYPSLFGFSVSHATRAPRPGEENGVHYNFVSVQEMERAIANNEFIEYAQVHTNYYGSSFEAVEKVRSLGKICILDIDIQGVQNVKKSSLDCEYIFIAPPSIEELEARLRGRGTETEEKIQVRMNNARGELAFGNVEGNFDLFVVNNDLEIAVESILSYLKKKFPSLSFD